MMVYGFSGSFDTEDIKGEILDTPDLTLDQELIKQDIGNIALIDCIKPGSDIDLNN